MVMLVGEHIPVYREHLRERRESSVLLTRRSVRNYDTFGECVLHRLDTLFPNVLLYSSLDSMLNLYYAQRPATISKIAKYGWL